MELWRGVKCRKCPEYMFYQLEKSTPMSEETNCQCSAGKAMNVKESV